MRYNGDIMLEEKDVQVEQDEELKDDGKIHFPLMGLVISGVLIVLMIICIIVILATRK